MIRDRIYRFVFFLVIGFVIRAFGTDMQSGMISSLGTIVLCASGVNLWRSLSAMEPDEP